MEQITEVIDGDFVAVHAGHDDGNGVTYVVDRKTAKIATEVALAVAIGAVGLSAIYLTTRRNGQAQFVNSCLGSLLALHIYKKFVQDDVKIIL